MRLKKIIILLAVLTASSSALAGLKLNHWEFNRGIRISPDKKSGEPVAVRLNPEIFNSSQPDYRDLRILSGEGDEVSYAIFDEEKKERTAPVPSKIIEKTQNAEATVLVIRLDEGEAAFDRVTVTPERSNFFRKIDIDGSLDLKTWSIIRKGSVLYACSLKEYYSRMEQLTNESYVTYGQRTLTEEKLTVLVPLSSYPYVRVRIPHDLDKEPVGIKNVLVSKSGETTGVEDVYQGRITERMSDRAKMTNGIIVDFGQKFIPLNRIEIGTTQRNFCRAVEIFGSNNPQTADWKRIGEGLVSSVGAEGGEESRRTVSFVPAKFRFLKISIGNGNNKPIEISSVTGFGPAVYAVFISEPGKTYGLRYGNPGAKKPDYDTELVLRGRDSENYTPAVLGPEERNPDFVLDSGRPWTEDRPYLLWASLAAAAAVLLFLAVNVLKTMD